MTKRILFLFTMLVWRGAIAAAPEADLMKDTNAQHIPFPDTRVTVNGLAWFEEDNRVLRRLPSRLKESFRPPVWSLAQQPSGGRLRFKTDSIKIGIRAQNPDTTGMHHMTTIGQSGFDIYVNNEYRGSAWPDKSGNIVQQWTVGNDHALRDITIYLPLYKAVTIDEIVLESSAQIEPPPAFAQPRPVVYYGTSITQGGCASNPGMSYEAQLSRWLDLDFINLGFSGNGFGEPAMAEAVSEINAAVFVLDYWANVSSTTFQTTLPKFVGTLRQKHPKTPIIITSPYFSPAEILAAKNEGSNAEKRKFAEAFVARQRHAGDKFITYVDGREMLSREQAVGLVDGVHCNSLGFYFCAKGLQSPLEKALKFSQKGDSRH